MAKIQRFEEIEAWQKARLLAQSIYQQSRAGAFSKDFELRGQARRAAISVMANIAEGFGRGGNREFIQFLSTAKGSCEELRSHMYVALDQQYLTSDEFAKINEQASEVTRLITGFMSYLQKSEFRGTKYLRATAWFPIWFSAFQI